MSILNEIAEAIVKGRVKIVKELVPKALEEGISAKEILANGLLEGMAIVGPRFKANEMYVPEVLMSARAMNTGAQMLAPYLADEGAVAGGKVILGTVKGDMHDIGKNLVKVMMEGRGLDVIDIGIDVPAEKFIEAAVEHDAKVIAASALLTTTMHEMQNVVDAAVSAGIRDKIVIMVGGAPITHEFCKSIGADIYAADAASAADEAAKIYE